jgi:hypothetical protein
MRNGECGMRNGECGKGGLLHTTIRTARVSKRTLDLANTTGSNAEVQHGEPHSAFPIPHSAFRSQSNTTEEPSWLTGDYVCSQNGPTRI